MKVVKLTDDYDFKSFDCGNDDLNEFLFQDSKQYSAKRQLTLDSDTVQLYFNLNELDGII